VCNTSVINLTKNPILHSRTKHIEVRHHFIKDHIVKGDYMIEYINTNDQLADIFTEPLFEDRLYEIKRSLEIIGDSLVNGSIFDEVLNFMLMLKILVI